MKYRSGFHFLTILITLLSGCAGTQYVQPPDSPDAARIQVVDDQNSDVHLVNFSKNGCYAGQTGIHSQDGKSMLRLTPGEEVFVGFRTGSGRDFCSTVDSFVPERGRQYVLSIYSRSGARGLLTSEPPVCSVSLKQVADDGTLRPVKIKGHLMKMTRPGCIRARAVE